MEEQEYNKKYKGKKFSACPAKLKFGDYLGLSNNLFSIEFIDNGKYVHLTSRSLDELESHIFNGIWKLEKNNAIELITIR